MKVFFKNETLVLDDGFTELNPRAGVFNGRLDGAGGRAEGNSSDIEARFVQRTHRDLETFAFLTQARTGRHADAIENHFRCRAAAQANKIFWLPYGKARRPLLDHETRDALMPRRRSLGRRDSVVPSPQGLRSTSKPE
mgnify:CR=1 FL=1